MCTKEPAAGEESLLQHLLSLRHRNHPVGDPGLSWGVLWGPELSVERAQLSPPPPSKEASGW